MGQGLVSAEEALQVWRRLPGDPSFVSAVIEDESTKEFFGFGAACFVTPEFAREEIETPRPNLNDRVIARLVQGAPVLLDRRGIGEQNAGRGLIQLQLYSTIRMDVSEEALMETRAQMMASLQQLNRGYRLWGSLGECHLAIQRLFSETAGCHIVDFAETGSYLYHISREDVPAKPGGVAMMMFQYQEPILRLSEADQELLQAAMDGATDEELGPILGLSLAAVKARWRALLARVERVKPEWGKGSDGAARGKQRRHYLLAYCREHPEELRPYAWAKQ